MISKDYVQRSTNAKSLKIIIGLDAPTNAGKSALTNYAIGYFHAVKDEREMLGYHVDHEIIDNKFVITVSDYNLE